MSIILYLIGAIIQIPFLSRPFNAGVFGWCLAWALASWLNKAVSR